MRQKYRRYLNYKFIIIIKYLNRADLKRLNDFINLFINLIK